MTGSTLALFCALSASLAAHGATAVVEPAKATVPLKSPVQDKNFYLLSMLERTAPVRPLLVADPELRRLAAAKRESLNRAVSSCDGALECYATAMKWSEPEMSEIAAALRESYRRYRDVRELVDRPLRTSGMFQRAHDRPGDELLIQAWLDAAHGINNIIDVYGTGKAPRYPAIDSVTYDTHSDSYHNMVRLLAAVVNEQSRELDLFFQPSLRFAMLLLDINGRNEAGRLEPLERGENAAAVRRIGSISWSRYPYSVIVVPGSGSDRLSVSFSPFGKLRVILAARRFHDGLAPLLLVSGGYVHPIETPFCEAVEMKKYLVKELGVPAEAILIEPHARHTTTNMRNAARQIYRYGIPFSRTALVTTDPAQSSNIESTAFADRCLRELGYQPYQVGRRISPFDLEFRPALESLQADPLDPLDP